jgi:hypothetical protein
MRAVEQDTVQFCRERTDMVEAMRHPLKSGQATHQGQPQKR